MTSIPAKNILITGKVGVGKTTIVKHLLHKISIPWGGYFTERVVEGKTTLAHRMVTSDGRAKIFADRSWVNLPQFGPMGVRVDVFEQLGVDILRKARQTAELIVMDEIGIMERNAKHFQQEVIACFGCPLPVIAVMKNSATDKWLALMSPDDYQIYNVIPQNRDTVFYDILELLQSIGLGIS